MLSHEHIKHIYFINEKTKLQLIYIYIYIYVSIAHQFTELINSLIYEASSRA